MAGDFDGSDFIALDDDTFGDGTTDNDTDATATHAASTFRLNRMDGNTRWLAGRGSRTPYAPIVTRTTRRKCSSYEWTIFKMIPLWTDPSLDSIRLSMLGVVDSVARQGKPAGATEDFNAKLEIWGSDVDPVEATWTGTDGDIEQFDIELTNINIAVAGWRYLILWTKSKEPTSVDESDTLSSAPGAYGVEADGATSAWKGALDAGHALRVAGSYWFDIIADSDYDPESDNTGHTVVPTQPSPIAFTNQLHELYSLTWLEPIAFHLKIDHGDDKATRTYYPVTAEELGAQQALRGSAMSALHRNAEAVYTRPKLLHIGPVGTETPESTWASNTHARWTFGFLNESSVTLEDAYVPVTRDAQTIEVQAILTFAHIVGSQINYVGDDSDWMDIWSATAEWDITLTVEQLDDGQDWTNATELASTTTSLGETNHWVTPRRGYWPLLQHLYWAFFQDGTAGGEYDFNFHEGQLFDKDLTGHQGLKVWTRHRFAVDVSTADIDRPVRVKLTAAETSGTSPTYNRSPESKDRLAVLCTSTAIYEYGDPSA